MNIKSCKKPEVIKNLISEKLLKGMQSNCFKLQDHNKIKKSKIQFIRKYISDFVPFEFIQHKYMTQIANEFFEEELKPSYNYTTLYDKEDARCPYHTDRPQCYRTIGLCINQNEPWPFFIAHEDTQPHNTTEYYLEKEEYYRSLGKKYILEPGDAIMYSGTQFPHWREQIQKDNFCHVVLFFFVTKDFVD